MNAFQVLGLRTDASADEIKSAYKRLSLKWHPDVVPVDRRNAAEAKFKEISAAYESALRSSGTFADGGPRAPINPADIRGMREQRQAGGARVWLHPAAVPLALAFLGLASLTVYQMNQAIERTRSASRPHGILGPAVNEFLREDQHPRVRPFSESSLGRMMGYSGAAGGRNADAGGGVRTDNADTARRSAAGNDR